MKNRIITLLISIIFFTACSGPADQGSDYGDLKNSNILMVIAPKDFSDPEYQAVRNNLENLGAAVKVASIQKLAARGVAGAEVMVDLRISEVNMDDFRGAVFIGGPGMGLISGDESLHDLARKFYHSEKIVGSVGLATLVLARSGLLAGRKATGSSETQGELEHRGAKFTAETITIDGRFVTAENESSALLFSQKISALINGKP